MSVHPYSDECGCRSCAGRRGGWANKGKQRRTQPPLERFLDKVAIDGARGCWLWQGVKSNGYGQFRVQGKTHKAHRFGYELLVGPVLDGLDLDHLCRVRHCVNPEHLEPVTRRENLRRSPLTGQGRTLCLHGHPLDGWDRKKQSRYCMTCNRMKNARWRAARRAS